MSSCTHVYWYVAPTERQRTITRARGKGRSRRTFEDVITETVPARSFWIADEAYRYCRDHDIPISSAKLSFSDTGSGSY